MKKIIICFVLFIHAVFSFGQNLVELQSKIDSLKAVQNYPEAINNALTLVDLVAQEFGKSDSLYAEVLFTLGELYRISGDYKNAEIMLKESADIRRVTIGPDHPNYANSIESLAIVYRRLSNFQKAEPLYLEAAAIRKKYYGEMHPEYAQSLNNMGILYKDMGDYKKAEALYLESLRIKINAYGESETTIGESLNQLGVLYKVMGNFVQAEKCFQRAMDIWKLSLGESNSTYIQGINNLGALYMSTGDYSKAEPLFIKAFELRKDLFGELNFDYATSINNLAVLYKRMGNFLKAELLYQKALLVYETMQQTDNLEYALTLNNYALVLDIQKKYDEAESMYEKSLEIRLKFLGAVHATVAESYNNMGILYQHKKEYEKSEDYFLKALEIAKTALGELHPSCAAFNSSLSALYLAAGYLDKALVAIQKSIEIMESGVGTNHPYYAQYLHSMAYIYDCSDSALHAEKYYLKSLTLTFEQIQRQLSFQSEKEIALYVHTLNDRFDFFSSFALRRKNDNPSVTGEVYNTVLKTKGILLKSSTLIRNTIYNSKDTALLNDYMKWQELKKKINSLYSQPAEKRKLNPAELEEDANALEKKLIKQVALIADMTSLTELKWEDVKSRLKPTEAAIEFTHFKISINSDSVIYCALVITSETEYPLMVPLFEEKELESLLGTYSGNNFNHITKLYGTKNKSNNELYKLIWLPLEEYLSGIKKVYISPSGLLHRISFAALNKSDGHFLADDLELATLATTYYAGHSTAMNISENDMVSLFGGISYSSIASSSPWNYLEGTKNETDELVSLFAKKKCQISYLTADLATKQKFISVASGSTVLHIATHGFFFPDPVLVKEKYTDSVETGDITFRGGGSRATINYVNNTDPMMRSGLILAGANDYWNGITNDEENNGVLTAQDLINIDMRNIKLVVLSACETGLGDIVASEGVYGLQRAFKMAGTDFIIMSLWQVPDKETATFMHVFYKLLFAKKDVSLAFSMTQSMMRKKYDPYYWAAFVLVR